MFGNESVFAELPTALQLDPSATLYLPPTSLAAIDLLPNTLVGAWSDDSEPKTTIADMYAALKTARGKAWPEKVFISTLNTAIGQGYMQRLNGKAPIVSLQHDGNIEIVIKSEAPKPPETMSPQPGRRFSNLMTLSVAELQDLADHVHALMKPLAGCDPQIEVRVTIKNESSGDLSEATKVLAQVKPGWKF